MARPGHRGSRAGSSRSLSDGAKLRPDDWSTLAAHVVALDSAAMAVSEDGQIGADDNVGSGSRTGLLDAPMSAASEEPRASA